MSMTLTVNNMADQTESAVQSDQSHNEILKVAQDQIAQAMSNAIENVSEKQGDVKQPEEFYEENLDYVEPMQDPYSKAIKYLENHNILQLFQQLTTSIVYRKPEQPLDFMMKEVERMKMEKEQEAGQKTT